jgi:hypothetical protein
MWRVAEHCDMTYDCIYQLQFPTYQNLSSQGKQDICSLLCVLGLYITRCPHSLHRICSVPFIGVFAPQSARSATTP